MHTGFSEKIPLGQLFFGPDFFTPVLYPGRLLIALQSQLFCDSLNLGKPGGMNAWQ